MVIGGKKMNKEEKEVFNQNLLHEYGIDYLTENEIKNCKAALLKKGVSNKFSTGGLFRQTTVQEMLQGTNSMNEAIFYQNMVIMSQLSRLNRNINVLCKKISESIETQTKELKERKEE